MTVKRRKKEDIKPIMVRMGTDFVACLDDLCEANKRSRREVIEILVDQAHADWSEDPAKRLNPL